MLQWLRHKIMITRQLFVTCTEIEHETDEDQTEEEESENESENFARKQFCIAE